MIPKIIHYIWFGGKPLPEKVTYCIESWKKWLPEYKFVLWNEESFDVNAYEFTRDTYAHRKFAFVSDFVRIFALATQGGVYLDTDIEIIKPLDVFLKERMVLGTDDSGSLTAFMAAEAQHPFFTRALDIYKSRLFVLPDGSLNTEVNNLLLQNLLENYGYVKANKEQHLSEGIKVYPDDYFHVVRLTSGKPHRTKNSYAIHWHTLLWIPWTTRVIRFIRMHIIVPVFGEKTYTKWVARLKK